MTTLQVDRDRLGAGVQTVFAEMLSELDDLLNHGIGNALARGKKRQRAF